MTHLRALIRTHLEKVILPLTGILDLRVFFSFGTSTFLLNLGTSPSSSSLMTLMLAVSSSLSSLMSLTTGTYFLALLSSTTLEAQAKASSSRRTSILSLRRCGSSSFETLPLNLRLSSDLRLPDDIDLEVDSITRLLRCRQEDF